MIQSDMQTHEASVNYCHCFSDNDYVFKTTSSDRNSIIIVEFHKTTTVDTIIYTYPGVLGITVCVCVCARVSSRSREKHVRSVTNVRIGRANSANQ